ncbi:PREDICTED: adenosine deaminase-like protein [Polistes canadensis]|uniref:adenosine deaminase-like protein n=1 Tax=Polistes canadensis TaxID=91411 RepID=UPI000718BB2F|nr:PREDICTED: adenosine deaminase-like protein [Polistes canadensis]
MTEERKSSTSNTPKFEILKKPISEDDEIKAFCKRLPKIELNANLTGCLSVSTVVRLYDRHPCEEKLNKYLDYFHSPKSFERYKKLYAMNDWLIGTPECITIAVCDVIREFLDDNICYLELKVTPQFIGTTLSKEQYIMSVINAVRLSEAMLPRIMVKIIFSINRADNYADCLDTCTLVFKYYKQYPELIVGIQLYGDPFYNNSYLNLLKICREYDLKIIMNCAEIPNHSETWEMIDFKPERLTHCTCVHATFNGADYLFEKLLESEIPVELCLTYDVDVNNVTTYREHIFKYLYQNKHPISISTRDKGICKTTLSEEYAIAAINFNLSKKDLLDLSKSTIKQISINEKEKDILYHIFTNFEQDEQFETKMF